MAVPASWRANNSEDFHESKRIECKKETESEEYASELIRSARMRLDVALTVFLVLLALVILLLCQRWGLAIG